jgi:hypothetical protein
MAYRRARWPHRCAAVILLGLTVLSTAALAQTKDSISIRSLPGYPPPGISSEWVDVRIERMGPATTVEKQEIDRFFDSIEATLSEYGIVRDWQLAIPDAPAIEITVELNGQQVRLTSAHVSLERNGNTVVTERGAEALDQRTRESVLAEQSEEFRRNRAAFERLLELTLERVQGGLSP